MTDLIGVAERKKQCGVCKQQCGEEQIEHMRKRQRKFQETASVSPEEKQERIRQKSELARNLRRAEEVMRRVKKLKTIDLPASEQVRVRVRVRARVRVRVWVRVTVRVRIRVRIYVLG